MTEIYRNLASYPKYFVNFFSILEASCFQGSQAYWFNILRISTKLSNLYISVLSNVYWIDLYKILLLKYIQCPVSKILLIKGNGFKNFIHSWKLNHES